MSVPAPQTPGARRRPPWWVWTVGAVLVVVGAIALLGGFADVPENELRVVDEGDAHVGGQLTTVIDRVYVSASRPGSGYDAPDGMEYLVVEATVENTTALPSTFVGRLVRVIVGDSVEASDSPTVLEARTGSALSFAQPGLPVVTNFVWEVERGDVALGDGVFLGFFEQYPIYGDPVFGDDAFGPPTATARMETSVGAAPAGADAPGAQS